MMMQMNMNTQLNMMIKQLIFILFILISLLFNPIAAKGLSPFAELLVLHASQETSSNWATVISGANRTLDFDATNINFHWSPGFRGGFQYESPCSSWDTKFYWTYFQTKKSNGFSIADQIIIPEFFSGFLSGNFFFGANINWQLVINTLDFELGRKFNISESISLRPSIGLKAATINQAILSRWNAGIYTATEHVKHNYSGVGPCLGIETQWNIYHTLSLFGDFSTAFLYGNWKVVDTYSRPEALGGLVTPTTITTSLNNTKLGTSLFKYRLGLQWIYEATFLLTLRLGYELQYWPNQVRLLTFQQLPTHGGLTLQGGTCQICIDL